MLLREVFDLFVVSQTQKQTIFVAQAKDLEDYATVVDEVGESSSYSFTVTCVNKAAKC